jgi:pyruvate kinase
MDYEIIPTLGPATDADAFPPALAAAGATGFRLNTSHLSLEALQGWLERLTRVFGGTPPVPLVLDLQGSKWRLGLFLPFELDAGRPVELLHGARASTAGVLPVPHSDFFRAARSSTGEILLDDARSELAIEAVEENRIRAVVVRGGRIAPHKGITFVRSEYRNEALSDKDREVVERTRGVAGIRYAVSYVRDATEMANYRALLAPSLHLIAKLERATALPDAAGIAQAADALWLCRGDLGAEMGARAMAEAVHGLTARVTAISVPVLLAGQVLEHMTENPSPTRSELCYLYDALRAGYRGVVLSDETAVGRYPVEACRAAALFR